MRGDKIEWLREKLQQGVNTEAMSDRQKLVLPLFMEGLGYADIGRKLGMERNLVQQDVETVYRHSTLAYKLKVR